nr:immunoglobulin heavy chain junction region [Macaca mulatta]
CGRDYNGVLIDYW